MGMEVIIVGGGIAGLAAAIGLCKAGHHVTVYEKSEFSRETGAAINICPNASRLLLKWGLDREACRLVTVREQVIMVGSTMQTITRADCSKFDETYGAPFLLAHRPDLHNALLSIARKFKPAMTLVLNAEVTAFNSSGSIVLEDGSVHAADLIVAADGVHTIAAKEIVSNLTPAVSTGQWAFRFLIPMEQIMADSETASMVTEGALKVAVGADSQLRLVWYPCAGETLLNFVGIHPGTAQGDEREDWTLSASVEDVVEKYADFHPTILKAVRKATVVKRWPLLYREPLSSWVKGRLVLIGDAAHPMLPHQGQGGAQAVEDAGALHAAFASPGTTAMDVEARLRLFDEIRRNRASAIQIFSNAGQDEPEKVRHRAAPFLPPGSKCPSSLQEYLEHNFSYDVLEHSKALMAEKSISVA